MFENSKRNLVFITVLFFSLIWVTFCDEPEKITRKKSSSSKASDSAQSPQTTGGENKTPDSSCEMKDVSDSSDLCTDYYNVQPAAVDSMKESCPNGTYSESPCPVVYSSYPSCKAVFSEIETYSIQRGASILPHMCGGGGGFTTEQMQYTFTAGASGTSNLTVACVKENSCDEILNVTQEFIDDIYKPDCENEGDTIEINCPAPFNSYPSCEVSAILYKKIVYEQSSSKEGCDIVSGTFRPGK